MKGVIITNGYSTLKGEMNQPLRLKEEFSLLNVKVDIVRNNFFPAKLINGSITVDQLLNYDFCIYLDKDDYLAVMLEKAGLKLFNNATAIRLCDDKMKTHIALAGSGIAMPNTIPSALCYTPNAEIEDISVNEIEKFIPYPIIVKESFGSLGKFVYKADNRNELLSIMNNVKLKPHVYQQFIKESSGKDVRIITVGNKAVASMLRVSNGDFRSNIELGGKGERFTPPDEYIEIAEQASKILGLDYAGIDVLFGKDGPILCEVNSNAFFGGIEKVTGTNIAKLYAEYILKTI